jgi:hypothetical protein
MQNPGVDSAGAFACRLRALATLGRILEVQQVAAHTAWRSAMALYSNGTSGPTSPAITGQYLAKAHLTRRQRAKLAAALSSGTAVLAPMTVKQAAAVAQVPVLDVTEARRNGKPHGNGRSNGHETLAEHFARTTAVERLEAARIIGPAQLWDTMISPVVSEDGGCG